MSSDCLFCKIAAGEIPSDILHRSENVVAFRDVNPQAPQHVLVIPVEHIETVADLEPRHSVLINEMVQVANQIARENGIEESGYRLVINKGMDGGQAVYHLHLHLLGGRRLSWPPG